MTGPAAHGTCTPLSGIGRTIARRMEEAWKAPAFHLTAELAAGGLDAERAGRAGVTFTDVLLSRCARALLAHPGVNAHYDPAGFAVTTFERADIGIAVATDRGLLVPVLRSVDAMSLEEIAAGRRELVERARAGSLAMADMQGGTFTVSNLGMFGIVRFDAILNVPQVAILATGAARTQYADVDGVPVPRRVVDVTLTCDHRALDGAAGAVFLRDLGGA